MRVKNGEHSSLAHLCPETHSEAQFAKHVAGLSKSVHAHAAQAEHIKTLAKKWTVRKILDIGAGEGTFTNLALELLRLNGAIVSETPIHIDVIEKDETLWQKCRQSLEKAGVGFRRVPFGDDLRSQLSSDRDELLAFAEHWKSYLQKTSGDLYDLIIGSHVTYYFDNGGADLAYAFVSRLLAPQGRAWFVVRDRDCPFYKYRDQILAGSAVPDVHRNALPDIHRDAFSDFFLNRLRCIIEDVEGCPPSIATQSRKLSLDLTEDPKAQVEYYMWLSGLSDDEVKGAVIAGSNDGFSETHIWLSPIRPLADHERHVLAATDIVARCIDLLRRVAPDLQAHRVSLASVEPKGPVPNPSPAAAADIERPSRVTTFGLWSVGYAFTPDTLLTKDLLKTYFKNNTSFLFYPRFYYDYALNCSGSPESCADYSLVEKLVGTPKYLFLEDYPRRTTERRQPDDALEEPGPSVERTNSESTAPLFSHSHREWVALQSAHYCAMPANDPEVPSLWSICIACNILPDLRLEISRDQLLSACSALFLTISSRHNLKNLAPYFVGQIKARLAQWRAEALYERLQERVDELERQAQMLELMNRPLRGISEALATMQSDTQELRALMFEPEESLFASFGQIEPFFVEGQLLPVQLAGEGLIRIHHSPDNYSDEELPIVLAAVLCAAVGKLDRLRNLGRADVLLALAAEVLDEVSERPATRGLARDLKWLVGLTAEASSPGMRPNWVRFLRSVDRLEKTRALRNIKKALFDPFKSGAREWSPIAFQLLSHHSKVGHKTLNPLLAGQRKLPKKVSPVSYAAVLAFVRDIAVALTSALRHVTSLAWLDEDGMVECRVEFSSAIPNDDDGIDREVLAKVLETVVTCPREWRIQGANYGDTTRPFVYLANKILGLGVRKSDIGRSGSGRWVPDDRQSDDGTGDLEVLAIRLLDDRSRRFSVVCGERCVYLRWR